MRRGSASHSSAGRGANDCTRQVGYIQTHHISGLLGALSCFQQAFCRARRVVAFRRTNLKYQQTAQRYARVSRVHVSLRFLIDVHMKSRRTVRSSGKLIAVNGTDRARPGARAAARGTDAHGRGRERGAGGEDRAPASTSRHKTRHKTRLTLDRLDTPFPDSMIRRCQDF